MGKEAKASGATTGDAAAQASGGIRYTELDSLRGVAALTVILYHFKLMWFGLPPWPHSWVRWVAPVTAGQEAVMLFFLLSGFVLAVPFLRGKGQPYPVYLTRRVLRIYGPYFFALLLAIAGAAIWHGPLARGLWANLTWNQPVHLDLVLKHMLMIGNFDSEQYNTAFWSLITEMRVSIVFPLLFWLVNRVRPWVALLGALVGTGAIAVFINHHPAFVLTLNSLAFAMIFVCGVVMAKNAERVNAWYRGLRPWMRVGFALASLVLYTWGYEIGQRMTHHRVGQEQVLMTLGAAGYLILALNAPWAKRVLGTKAARFLGRISYSLYLVHGTVLFALAHVFGNRLSVGVQFCLFVPLSIGLSYLFCVGIEERFLQLSRMVGKRWAVLPDGRAARAASVQTPF